MAGSMGMQQVRRCVLLRAIGADTKVAGETRRLGIATLGCSFSQVDIIPLSSKKKCD